LITNEEQEVSQVCGTVFQIDSQFGADWIGNLYIVTSNTTRSLFTKTDQTILTGISITASSVYQIQISIKINVGDKVMLRSSYPNRLYLSGGGLASTSSYKQIDLFSKVIYNMMIERGPHTIRYIVFRILTVQEKINDLNTQISGLNTQIENLTSQTSSTVILSTFRFTSAVFQATISFIVYKINRIVYICSQTAPNIQNISLGYESFTALVPSGFKPIYLHQWFFIGLTIASGLESVLAYF
jgi:hypothetical protein